jgi:hypothetical protein
VGLLSDEVVVQDAAIGQHEVDHLMASANYALYRPDGDAAIDVGYEMQTRGTIPGAMDDDVLEVVADQLGDLQLAVYVRQQLGLTLSLAMPLATSSRRPAREIGL